MDPEVTILVAEDDEGHAILIERNLRRAGILNELVRFKDGEAVVGFLCREGSGPFRKPETPYLLLLDIRMPKMDGVDVLKRIKNDEKLKVMPVIMLTTTDDPREIETCHLQGCNNYIVKPVEYDRFVETIHNLGAFLDIVRVPDIEGKVLCVKGDVHSNGL